MGEVGEAGQASGTACAKALGCDTCDLVGNSQHDSGCEIYEGEVVKPEAKVRF